MLDKSECFQAMKEIRERYPRTQNDLRINPELYNPWGCVVRCNWDMLNEQNCYSRESTSLVFTWNENKVVFGPGEKWRFVCKATG